jgi:hypothetical protein
MCGPPNAGRLRNIRLGSFAALIAVAALVGCGSHRVAASDPAVNAALGKLQSVIRDAAHAPSAQPGFKIAVSGAQGVHGLDLWYAVVDPMIGPLTPLDGRAELHRQLNPSQYAVYALFAVATDYDDGGIFEVYYNNSGVFANEAVHLLGVVGAPIHAAALARANRVGWPRSDVPYSQAARRRVISLTDQPRFALVNAGWDNAERKEGSLYSIIERFIRVRPGAFFS